VEGSPGNDEWESERFSRVAPSDLFNLSAILRAGVFLRASVFSSRISVEVRARRFFDFLGIFDFLGGSSFLGCGPPEPVAGLPGNDDNESPMLNAFARVAPSDLFNVLAILRAGVFLRAIVG
jgi:hypothetical protein